jgi:N-acetylneuraminic acid mutarotase
MRFVEPLESRCLLAATHLRINAGGEALVDSSGKSWQADRGFSGGAADTASFAVANTNDDDLLATQRRGTFGYSFRVNNGDYRLKLYFADATSTAKGQRRFNVSAEKREVLSNFDVVASAGAKSAFMKSINVSVRDRHLSLWFQGDTDDAIVSAIELVPRSSSSSTSDKIDWSAGIDSPITRFEAMGAVARRKLFIFGGFFNAKLEATNRVDRFDPASGKWKRLSSMPEATTHSAVAYDGEIIWSIGGYIGAQHDAATNHVWKYSVAANTWSRGPDLPAPRGGGGAAIVNGQLHFFSGSPNDGPTDRGEHWSLPLDGSTTWDARERYPNPVTHLSAVSLGDKIYAFGGEKAWDEQNGNQTEAYRYDPVMDKWTSIASLPKARSHFASSTFVAGEKIVAIGGSTNGGTQGLAMSDADEYDPATNTWRTLTSIPESLKVPVAGYIRGKFYVTTGSIGEFADPQKDTWVGTLV